MSVHFRHFYDKRKHAVSSCANPGVRCARSGKQSIGDLVAKEWRKRRELY